LTLLGLVNVVEPDFLKPILAMIQHQMWIFYPGGVQANTLAGKLFCSGHGRAKIKSAGRSSARRSLAAKRISEFSG
jgi:hypothetical protein